MWKICRKEVAALLALCMVVCLALPAAAAHEWKLDIGEEVTFTCATCSDPFTCTAEQWQNLYYTNCVRLENGREPLSTFSGLQAVAQTRAGELIKCFEHTRPDGSSCFTALDAGGVDYQSAGENIAAGYPDTAAAVRGWVNSPGHFANLIGNYSHIGAGYYYYGSDDYKRYYAQMFLSAATCARRDMQVVTCESVPVGTDLAALSAISALAYDCPAHGECFLPLHESMISGYDPTQPGEQTLTIRLGEDQITATIFVCPFSDVGGRDWFLKAVEWAYESGCIKGVRKDYFGVAQPTTRGTVATILGRMSGNSDVCDGTVPFPDVAEDKWYAAHIAWAAENHILQGYQDGTARPDQNVTRQELAKLFYQYARFRGMNVSAGQEDLSSFADGDSVDAWAEEAMRWAVHVKLIQGSKNGDTRYLKSGATATRAEVVQMLYNFSLITEA